MTSSTSNTLVEDLAYVRDLAEAGHSAPLLGGRFLAWWGGLLTLAYAGHYVIGSGLGGLSVSLVAWMWGAFIVLGLSGHFWLIRSVGNKPGISAIGNRVEATVWTAAGFALSAYFLTLIVQSLADGAASEGFARSLPIVFSVYGIGLITSGHMGKSNVLTYAGYGALAMIALAVWFASAFEIWVVAALAAFLTVFIPSIILLRHEPRSIV